MRFTKHDKKTTEERFWAKVQIGGPDDCWPWLATKDARGYGMFAVGRRPGRASHMIRANRFVLELKEGRELVPGEESCHHCTTKSCCNTGHLYIGSRAQNMADLVAARTVAGENHARSKLRESDVEDVIRLRAEGMPLAVLAERYGISTSHMSRVTRGMRKKGK